MELVEASGGEKEVQTARSQQTLLDTYKKRIPFRSISIRIREDKGEDVKERLKIDHPGEHL